MKRILSLLLLLILTGCDLIPDEYQDKVHDLDIIDFTLKDSKTIIEYPLTEEFMDLVDNYYINKITEVEGFLFVHYFDDQMFSRLAMFNPNIELVRTFEDDLSYGVSLFTYNGKFVIDFADHANHLYRLVDPNGVVDENQVFTQINLLSDTNDVRIFYTESITDENEVIDIIKVEQNQESVIYTTIKTDQYTDYTSFSDGSVALVTSSITGYNILHIDVQGTTSVIAEVNRMPMVYGLDNNLLVQEYDTVTLYDISGNIIDVFDDYGYLYGIYDLEEYTVIMYTDSFVLLEGDQVVSITEDFPLYIVELEQGRIVHQFIEIDGELQSEVRILLGDIELYTIQVDPLHALYHTTDTLYLGREENGLYEYTLYNNKGEYVEDITLQGAILSIDEDGHYIIDSCNNAQELGLCISSINHQGMEMWRYEPLQSYVQKTVNENLYAVMTPQYSCDYMAPGWTPCNTTFIDNNGDVVFDGSNEFEDFRFLYSDQEYIYARGIRYYDEPSYGGIYQYSYLVYDYDFNVIAEYEEVALDYFSNGVYYIKDNTLIYEKD